MTSPLNITLTFAEVGFALAASPAQADAVRGQLRLGPGDGTREVLAAGVSSLLVRGLCTIRDNEVVPGTDLVAITASLATFTSRTEVVGYAGDRGEAWHVFTGPNVRLVLVAQPYRRYTAVFPDAGEPLSSLVTRMMDSVVGAPKSGMLARTMSGDVTAGVAVAVDEAGGWHVSDHEHTTGEGVPASREAAIVRMAELFDAVPGAAR